MKITNASATNSLQLHDQLGPNGEEQWQGGLKNVVVPAGGSVIVSNTNAAESRSLQTAIAAGDVTVDITVEPNDGSALPDTVPSVPGAVIGTGGVAFIGNITVPDSGSYVIAFEPGVAGADAVVRGLSFADQNAYGVVKFDLAGALDTDVTVTKEAATPSTKVTFTDAAGAGGDHTITVIIS